MSRRTAVPSLRALPVGVLLVVVLVAAARLWPATAQDATPAASPEGSPVFERADCAEPLGLAPGGACVVVVHAAAEVGEVDVYVDGEQLLGNLAFGGVSGYVAVPAGERQVQVTAAGTPVAEAVVDQTLTLEAGVAYEVAAVGAVAPAGLAVSVADLEPLLDDNARVRVFQAIAGAPPSDVLLANGDPVLRNVTVGMASAYAEVPAGVTPIDLEVRPQGLPIAFPISGATLEPGLVYTFYAMGSVTDPTSLRVVPVIAPSSDAPTAGTPVASPQAIPLIPGTPIGSPTTTFTTSSPTAGTPVASSQ